MSVSYLRVGTTWSKIFTADEHTLYARNITGYPVQFFITTKANPSADTEQVFTMGGMISTPSIPQGASLYAKASTDADNIILAVSDVRFGVSKVSVDFDLEGLLAEVIKISGRITTVELDQLHQRDLHYQLLRAFVKYSMSTDTAIGKIYELLTGFQLRLLTAETWIIQHRAEFEALKADIAEYDEDRSEEIADLTARLTNLIAQATAITDSLREIEQEIDGSITERTAQLSEELEQVNNDLASLNNAITALSTKNTVEEIIAAGDAIAAELPEDASAALRSAVAGLTTIISKIATKVDYDDTVVLNASLNNFN